MIALPVEVSKYLFSVNVHSESDIALYADLDICHNRPVSFRVRHFAHLSLDTGFVPVCPDQQFLECV